MANTITGLNDDIISQAGLEAFTAGLAPLKAFSTDFSGEAGRKGESVSVPLVSSATAGTFAGNLETGDSTLAQVEVTLASQPVFSAFHITDTESTKSSVAQLERLAKQHAQAVAQSVVVDVMGEITQANYGNVAATVTAANFDYEDIVDIRTVCTDANMPADERYLILDSGHYGNLLKDTAISNNSAFNGNSAQSGEAPKVAGFDLIESTVVPDNSENLVGFASHPSGMAVAMRYWEPQSDSDYIESRAILDQETGLVLGYRRWYNPATATHWASFDCLHGKKVGVSDGIKRIVSS